MTRVKSRGKHAAFDERSRKSAAGVLASPRGAGGLFIGAKSYALGNLDLEQALTAKWSVVVFGDALATAAELRHYPLAGERLYSAGLGVRYQTLIGPSRVEYGRNLNPRAGDPGGTWQISVGAPF